jgi:hypothetical protein
MIKDEPIVYDVNKAVSDRRNRLYAELRQFYLEHYQSGQWRPHRNR